MQFGTGSLEQLTAANSAPTEGDKQGENILGKIKMGLKSGIWIDMGGGNVLGEIKWC